MTRPRTCRVCGCTDEFACEGGCTWLDERDNLCSRCVAAKSHVVRMTIEHVSPGKSFHVATCKCGWSERHRRKSADHRTLDGKLRDHWRAIVAMAEVPA